MALFVTGLRVLCLPGRYNWATGMSCSPAPAHDRVPSDANNDDHERLLPAGHCAECFNQPYVRALSSQPMLWGQPHFTDGEMKVWGV